MSDDSPDERTAGTEPQPEHAALRDASTVSRREFVHAAALGGALALARGRLPGRPPGAAGGRGPAPDGSPNAATRPVTVAPVEAAPFELEEATIAQLQAGMASGQYTARTLVERYLARIAELDRTGPSLQAVLETNPDALAAAEALDAERRTGRVRGPLHGIPILIKDNIATADRMATAAGSLALAGRTAPRDAFVVERLRAAGAVLLGKTNLSEWANFRSSHSSSGWSGRGGQARNPYALDRSPSGSSSGSGIAAAASYCAAAVGTETDGSIVSPSSANSVVGIKPTVGLVSRSGIIPIAHSQDTAGPMARTVADAAALLSAMAGVDARDATTAAARGRTADYTRSLDAAGLRGARLGVARKRYTGYSTATDALFEQALGAMREAGAVIVDPADIATAGKFGDAEYEVLLYEFKADLNAYLAGLGPSAPVQSLAGVIEFNTRNAAREMPYFGQDIFLEAQAKGPLTERAYRTALASSKRLAGAQGIDATMAKYRLDAIVAPTSGPPWLIDLVNGDSGGGGSSSPAAVAGYPSITVPAGYVFGLPVGVSFFGRAWSEPTLIRLAYAFEQATKVRRPPRFLPTAEFA